MSHNRRLRRAEAAPYLLETHGIGRAVGTLAKLAVVGGGPRFRVAGRTPLYSTDDLDAWAESILSPPVGSTSELSEWRERRAERAGGRPGAVASGDAAGSNGHGEPDVARRNPSRSS